MAATDNNGSGDGRANAATIPQALLFDFNGTISQDEDLLCEIFQDLFAEVGKPLTTETYFEELAGLPDEEILKTWLGNEHPELTRLLQERVRRYAVQWRPSMVPASVRQAINHASERIPIGLVSAALRADIDVALGGSGLARAFGVVVAAEDVARPKPDPEGYLRAAELLGAQPTDVVVFEDTDLGVAAAKSSGARCIAVLGTLPASRLHAADAIVESVDVRLINRVLGEVR
jgi:HAD superfamily hydrolase (TIGR01509 family)